MVSTRQTAVTLLSLLTLVLSQGCRSRSTEVPHRWAALGIPKKGLRKVLQRTSNNGFFADYEGYRGRKLFEVVSKRLVKAG